MMGRARARPIRWADQARELSAHRAALQSDPRDAARSIPGAVMGNDRRCDLARITFGPSPPYVAMGAVVVAWCVQIGRRNQPGIAGIRKPRWQIRNIAIGVDRAAADLKPLDPIPVIVRADTQRAHKGSVGEISIELNLHLAAGRIVAAQVLGLPRMIGGIVDVLDQGADVARLVVALEGSDAIEGVPIVGTAKRERRAG